MFLQILNNTFKVLKYKGSLRTLSQLEIKGHQPWPLLFTFILYKQHLQKNCLLQRDSNLDHRSRHKACTLTTGPSPRPFYACLIEGQFTAKVQNHFRINFIRTFVIRTKMSEPHETKNFPFCFFLFGRAFSP